MQLSDRLDILITVKEAAIRLGVDRMTVFKWLWMRKLEYHKIGRKSVRIPVREIERILDETRVRRKTA